MRLALLILTILIGTSCTGKSDSADLHTASDAGAYTKFVNQKKMPSNPNLTLDKTIINHKYPIEIALYKDGRFFYDLPNLGTGKGKWKYTDGKIELRATRKIFDMYIEVYGADTTIETAAIQFNDRFGSNTLKMENKNL
jgi:hypothetical protein